MSCKICIIMLVYSACGHDEKGDFDVCLPLAVTTEALLLDSKSGDAAAAEVG